MIDLVRTSMIRGIWGGVIVLNRINSIHYLKTDFIGKSEAHEINLPHNNYMGRHRFKNNYESYLNNDNE